MGTAEQDQPSQLRAESPRPSQGSDASGITIDLTRTSTYTEEAAQALRAVENDPAKRLDFARQFFIGPNQDLLAFARSELAFMEWEVERGCLNALDDPQTPGSPWWRKVNGLLLQDAYEARLRFDAGERAGTAPADLKQPVRRWLEFLDKPTDDAWYRAHNTSIVTGYLDFGPEAAHEGAHEQKLMNIVLYRVLFTQAVLQAEPWTFGWLSRFLPFLVRPQSRMVRSVVSERGLYPKSYPLDAQDQRSLERKSSHLGSRIASLIDLVVIASRLRRLYHWASIELDIPELRDLIIKDLPGYPWSSNLHPNEWAAISLTDSPSFFQRLLARLMHGALG